MNLRENAMAIYKGEQPDFYGDLMDAVVLLPDFVRFRSTPVQDGREYRDCWGTVYVWKPEASEVHPLVNAKNAVIRDMEVWKEQLAVPEPEELDWESVRASAAAVDRNEKFLGALCGVGLFERTHYLMGMENALVSYLEYPDEMEELLRIITDYKTACIRRLAEEIHPDILFFRDNWGSSRNLFLPPRIWRDMIRPLQKEIADTIHSCGMLYVHHADCFCQPLAADMTEIGIDIWHGITPQNDIPGIQEMTGGKLALAGGIDGTGMDTVSVSETEIRQEVRRAVNTYCPAGRFYPGITGGAWHVQRNYAVYRDELEKYGREFAEKHPLQQGKNILS